MLGIFSRRTLSLKTASMQHPSPDGRGWSCWLPVCFDIKVPTERVVETKNGKRVEKEVKIWPGYILLEMELPNLGWKEIVSPIKRLTGRQRFRRRRGQLQAAARVE